MNQHLQSTNDVVTSVRERLASAAKPIKALEGVLGALTQRYSSIEIYLAVAGSGVCKARSDAKAGTTMADVNAEIAVPIMLGAKTLGLLVAETGRTSGSARHWARGAPQQEHALLEQVAKLIAEHVAANSLTANRGKQAPRKTSDTLHAAPASAVKRKAPQSARAAVRKAAAGDRFPR